MNQALDELLSDIFTGEIAIRELSGREEFAEGDGLRGKWEVLLWCDGHAQSTPEFEATILEKLYWRSCMSSSVQKIQGRLSRKTNPLREIRLYF